MPERPLEEVIQERAFTGLLQSRSSSLFRLINTLPASLEDEWSKKHFFQLISETDELESFLDDFGARFNRSFAFLRELVASARWFALTGFSLSHLESRIDSYRVRESLSDAEQEEARVSLGRSRSFVREASEALLRALRTEAEAMGLEPTPETLPESSFEVAATRQLLPRNLGQSDLVEEEQKIAEVASKFLAACELLEDLRVRRIRGPADRRAFLARTATETQARVYEATVHNLQSTYDTYIKNTRLESQDDRLPRLRGHASAALHLLESVTFLTHFVERHASGTGHPAVEPRLAEVVDRERVQEIILNHLLFWADLLMQRGRSLAGDLLPAYTNLQELTVELPRDVRLHARPAALIVGIVGRHGTPVELDVGGQRCNASSILEVLVAVGSNPEVRKYVFRGDENPLRDIRLLFEHGLGEHGMDSLPRELQYLRSPA